MADLSDVQHKACALLGSTINEKSEKFSKAQSLCSLFIGAAVEEVYLAIPWPFALSYQLFPYNSPDSSTFVPYKAKISIDSSPLECKDILKILTFSPSNLEWKLKGLEFFFKGTSVDGLVHWSSNILNEFKAILRANRMEAREQYGYVIPEMFLMLAAYNLAANVAYPLHGDAAFSDGIRLQYLKKLEECRRIYPIEWHVENAYLTISVMP